MTCLYDFLPAYCLLPTILEGLVHIVWHALLIPLTILVQSTFCPKLSVWEIRPDLVLLAVLYIGVVDGQTKGTVFGFMAGFLQDVYAPEHLGANALAKSIVGFGVGYSRSVLAVETILVQALVTFVATLAHDLIYAVGYALGGFPDRLLFFVRYSPGTALYTTLAGIVVALLLSIRMRGGLHFRLRSLFAE